MRQSYYIGIDISKSKLDIAVITSTYENVRYEVVNNNKQTLKAFFTKLLRQLLITASEVLVCCEQTGIWSSCRENLRRDEYTALGRAGYQDQTCQY